MPKLKHLAGIVRSKNATAFLMTMDIMFDDPAVYAQVKASGVLTPQLFADLYQVPLEQVKFLAYDPALAIKCTVPRPIPSGEFGDTDVYGCQQHLPLLDVEIPIDVQPVRASYGER